MLGIGMGLWRDARRSGWDPDAFAYIAQVEAADGQPLEPKVKLAVNRFVRQCKRDASPVAGVSNWEALKSSCLLAGPRTLAGALVPLRGPAPTNFNFVSGDYSATTGLKGNGTSKVLGTNYTNVGTSIDIHVSVFSTTDFTVPGVAANYIANEPSGSNPGLTRIIKVDDSTTSFRVIDWTGFNIANPAPPNNVGFLGCSAIPGSASVIAYSFPESGGIGTRVNHAIYNSPFYVFGNPSSNFSSARLSFYSVGKSINLNALRSAVNAYMEAVA